MNASAQPATKPSRRVRACLAALGIAALALLGVAATPRPAAADIPLDGHTYVISQALHQGYALDVFRVMTDNNTPVIGWPVHGQINQQWTFRASANHPGWFHLVSRADPDGDMCLDVTGSRKDPGAPVALYDCDPHFPDQPNQLWKPELYRAGDPFGPLNGGWFLINKNSGLVLSPPKAWERGGQYVQAPAEGGGQKFVFHPATPFGSLYWETVSVTVRPSAEWQTVHVTCHEGNVRHDGIAPRDYPSPVFMTFERSMFLTTAQPISYIGTGVAWNSYDVDTDGWTTAMFGVGNNRSLAAGEIRVDAGVLCYRP